MSTDAAPRRRLTSRLVLAVFALLFGLLAFGYFLFLRDEYVPVFAQVRPGEAAAIVTQLEGKDVPYRLTDGGTTILIPANQADMARLAIAGSDVALKGGVGFELFNKSDMGLTDFAQRINYQRALQGELERSIMMIAEVDTARVHLAMPERTIFRAERSNAKAAVEIVAKPGRAFDDARVAGVQQLVSFAVPDLAPGDVVVLDGSGRILSGPVDQEPQLSPDAEERRGVQGYYRARARAAMQQTLPAMQADVTVLMLGTAGSENVAPMPSDAADTPPARNFRLRVIVATSAPLNADDAMLARNAVASALALDETAGDELIFHVGLATRGVSPVVNAAATPRSIPLSGEVNAAETSGHTDWIWWIAGGFAVLVMAGIAILWRRRTPRLSPAERDAMIARLREALRTSDHAASAS